MGKAFVEQAAGVEEVVRRGRLQFSGTNNPTSIPKHYSWNTCWSKSTAQRTKHTQHCVQSRHSTAGTAQQLKYSVKQSKAEHSVAHKAHAAQHLASGTSSRGSPGPAWGGQAWPTSARPVAVTSSLPLAVGQLAVGWKLGGSCMMVGKAGMPWAFAMREDHTCTSRARVKKSTSPANPGVPFYPSPICGYGHPQSGCSEVHTWVVWAWLGVCATPKGHLSLPGSEPA